MFENVDDGQQNLSDSEQMSENDHNFRNITPASGHLVKHIYHIFYRRLKLFLTNPLLQRFGI